MSIEAEVVTILKDVSVEEVSDNISWDVNLQDELDLDSMDILELYQGVQKKFQIDFSAEEIGKAKTIAEITFLIQSYQQAA